MKKSKLIFLCIVVVIAAILIVAKAGSKSQNSPSNILSQTTGNILAPQTNSEGSVMITVNPKVLKTGKAMQFDITLTTHTGSLDSDLLQVSKLVDDTGNAYKPTSWSGGKGGHHLEGVLSFLSLSEKAKKVTFTISGIDNHDRVFMWQL